MPYLALEIAENAASFLYAGYLGFVFGHTVTFLSFLTSEEV